MKRFVLLVALFIIHHSLFLIPASAQSNPDTVNGWFLRDVVGNDSALTHSRIVADTAMEGTRSQAFYFYLPQNTAVRWQKNYARTYTMSSVIQVWIRLNHFGIGQLQTVRFQFFVAANDSLYPVGTPATIGVEQLNLWFEYTINRGSAPSTFDRLALKLYFNPSSANGDAEVFFDDLRLIYFNGGNLDSVIVLDRFGDTTVTGIKEIEGRVPQNFYLAQNYPNPFNPETRISYTVSRMSMVTLTVYDALGREIAVLVAERKYPGRYEVRFDASGLPSGIYFYRLAVSSVEPLQAGAFTEVRKMILMK